MDYVPDRGDIIWITFDPQAGREQAGRRPALVLSPAYYNRKADLLVCCPMTRQVKGYTYEVAIHRGEKIEGAVLADHLKSMDWKVRKAKFMAKMPVEVVEEILARVETLLGPFE